MRKTEMVAFILTLSFLTALLYSGHLYASSYHVSFTDGAGRRVAIDRPPSRVVSLVPSVTDILVALGMKDELEGLTYHDSHTEGKELLGGFLYPSLEKIEALEPDLMFVASVHRDAIERLKGKAAIVELDAHSIEDIYGNIRIVGRIFQKESEAEKLVKAIREEIELVAKKLSHVPRERRKRVARIMGGDRVMVPGDDSFQLDYIRAAGAIPLTTGKQGDVVSITKKEWMEFNPQVIYACNKKSRAIETIENEPGWKDVEAVKEGRILFFPCELTCRASVSAGHFVSWLASNIYVEEFAKSRVYKDAPVGSKTLPLELAYVEMSRIDHVRINDFIHKSLIVRFRQPLKVLSTLEGWREGVRYVGNHYLPPQNWAVAHRVGLKRLREQVCRATGLLEEEASLLFTGADMDNLSVAREDYRGLTVYAIVTAGVRSNALRASEDEGSFYRPGTINIIIMANRKLSPRAMARALITATEAKTAALQDLDIRSSQSPAVNQATGTGTDNIIVVEGTGADVDATGGHTKVGEVMGRAVFRAVKEAVFKQNGIGMRRSVFERLAERNIEVYSLLDGAGLSGAERARLVERLEQILTLPLYASFVEGAFLISDGIEHGSIGGLDGYMLWCVAVAERLSKGTVEELEPLVNRRLKLPVALRRAFNCLFNGILMGLRHDRTAGER